MTEDQNEAVRVRAYELWQSDGRPDGRHETHWHQALAELGLVPPFDEDRAAIAAQARAWEDDADRSQD